MIAPSSVQVNAELLKQSDEQLKYVLSSIDDSTFLNACPGSGKTEVVGLKAAYEFSRWEKNAGWHWSPDFYQ